MSLRKAFVLLGLGVAATAAVAATGIAGCQGNSNNGSGGSGGGATTTSTSTGTGAGGSSTTTTTSAGGGGGGTTGSGGNAGCDGQVATIQDITTMNNVGTGIAVKVQGVVAMSKKFLVVKSKSGSCLWGVFVSAPGLAETAPNTGILALSYGFQATIPDGGTTAYCPLLGKDALGDKIPDDVKPGDVLDLVGKTDYYLPSCGSPAPQVAEYQLSNVCSATKTGTAPVPTAHVMTAADIANLSSPSNKAFHDQWGGVKVRVENVTALGMDAGTDQFGNIQLNEGNLEVGDKVYYQGYFAKSDFCQAGPVFATSSSWNFIQGFSYLNCNVWDIVPNDKCADFDPPSDDCMGNAAACTK